MIREIVMLNKSFQRKYTILEIFPEKYDFWWFFEVIITFRIAPNNCE